MKIPDGWKKVRLDKVAQIQTGIAKNSKILEDSVKLPYLRVANVQDGHLDLRTIKFIQLAKDKVGRYLLQEGDVLLTEGGDFDKLGRGTIWKKEIDDCVHQNHVFVARPENETLMPEFLTMQTGGPYGKRYFQSCSKQSTNLASINSSQLKAFPVLLPPLPEQKAIAGIFETWDRAIEKTERLINAKQKRFNALMRKLICDNSQLRIKNGELKTAKSGWRVVKLGDVCDIVNKKRLSVVDHKFVLTVKLHCRGIVKNIKAIPKLTEKGRPYHQHKSGDFLIGRQNFHNGGFGIVPEELDGGITSNAITALCIKEKVLSKEFLWYQFSDPNYYKRIGHGMDGTGQKELSEKQILKLGVFLPPLREQTQIAETLNAAQTEIDLLKNIAEKYKTQKRGLMQKLLTGEWRVPCGTSAEV